MFYLEGIDRGEEYSFRLETRRRADCKRNFSSQAELRHVITTKIAIL